MELKGAGTQRRSTVGRWVWVGVPPGLAQCSQVPAARSAPPWAPPSHSLLGVCRAPSRVLRTQQNQNSVRICDVNSRIGYTYFFLSGEGFDSSEEGWATTTTLKIQSRLR